jgi:hypothetical protein
MREPSTEIPESSAAGRRASTVPYASSVAAITLGVRTVTSRDRSPRMRARTTDMRALVVTGVDADVRLEL